jgi:hypothetical protein
MSGCLSPKKTRKSASMKHCTYSFKDDFEAFSYTVFALCVMDSHFLLGTGRLQVSHEFFVEVLASSIRVKGFDG